MRDTAGGNGREYRLPDVPNLSVDGFCVQIRTMYEFFDCFWDGHTCLKFRDVIMKSGETLAERYEQTMQRVEKITRAGYQVIAQWECEFDREILSEHPELLTHRVFESEHLNTRDAL
jgi:G:T-mismatch repair DNA endonuclease (very short patch repair protein)